MNNFTMTCVVCDKNFAITDANRRDWIKGTCDTCLSVRKGQVVA